MAIYARSPLPQSQINLHAVTSHAGIPGEDSSHVEWDISPPTEANSNLLLGEALGWNQGGMTGAVCLEKSLSGVAGCRARLDLWRGWADRAWR